jgi:hypothetical protein
LYRLALSAEEVATVVKLMFDTLVIDQDSEVLAPLTSDNPPLEVIYCLASDHNLFDGAFPEVVANIVLSSDDDDDAARPPEHDAPTDRKVLV